MWIVATDDPGVYLSVCCVFSCGFVVQKQLNMSEMVFWLITHDIPRNIYITWGP